MKLKTYFDIYRLDEEYATGSRSKPISQEEAKDIIYTKCGDILDTYIKRSGRIYRGAGYSSQFLYIEPSKFNRVSRNTSNYFTTIVDNSPRWKKYPPRSKSIICSLEYRSASSYGFTYVVFPFDGSDIGVCPLSDVWISFPKLRNKNGISIDFFNSEIDSLLENIGERYKKYYSDNSTYKQLLDGFSIIDEYRNDIKSDYDDCVFDLFKKQPTSLKFIDFIEDLLDPRDNGFIVVTPKTFPSSKDREVWLSGNSVLVSSDISENFIKELSMRN